MGRGRKASIERERVRQTNKEQKGREEEKEGGRERGRERQEGMEGGRERGKEGEKGIRGEKNKTDGDSGNRKMIRICMQEKGGRQNRRIKITARCRKIQRFSNMILIISMAV